MMRCFLKMCSEYGVPGDIRAKAETFLDEHLLKTLHDFERVVVDE